MKCSMGGRHGLPPINFNLLMAFIPKDLPFIPPLEPFLKILLINVSRFRRVKE
jgi:hypothetical protein